MFLLLFKVTVLLLAGLVALLATGKSSAANRHLLCLCVLGGAVIMLPAGSLARVKPFTFRTQALDAAVRNSPAMTHAAALPWRSLVLTIWAFGAMILLLRLAFGYWRLSRLKRESIPLTPPLFTAQVNVPIASGLFRPVVLLPPDAALWPEWQRTAAIRHEMAHIERLDLWANLLANLACALYWFHPLVWAMAAHLRREQEAACDDSVIHAGFDRTVYAEALLAVAKNSPPTLIPGCYMTKTSDVKSRILRLLAAQAAPRTTFLRTASAFAGIVLAFAALAPVRAEKIYTVGRDVTAPRVLQKIDPAYPGGEQGPNVNGTVVLSCVIGTDGMAHDISIVRSLEPSFDKSAAEAIEQWRFAPGTHEGEPVPVRATIEVNFKRL